MDSDELDHSYLATNVSFAPSDQVLAIPFAKQSRALPTPRPPEHSTEYRERFKKVGQEYHSGMDHKPLVVPAGVAQARLRAQNPYQIGYFGSI